MRWYLISLLLWPFFSLAQLHVAKVFSHNMVLQRGAAIHIWGKDIPGKKIRVSFAYETKTTITHSDSTWNIYLKKQKSNSHPQSIAISSENETVTFRNVLIGDVWLCSGQSNMELPMVKEAHWNDEKRNAFPPMIRVNNPLPIGRNIYGIAYTDSLNKRLNQEDFYQWFSWQTCDSNTIQNMSAVGYYFAKSISQETGIPLGLINLSIGGAPIETFIEREAMMKDSRFASKVQGYWLENKNLPEWTRERGKQNIGNNPYGFKDELGLNHAYKPGFAYESGVKPLLPFPIKGVIWYQGESNSLEKDRVEEYRALLHLLITNYRNGWKQPDMPFYWVQLSSIDTTNYKSHYWPQFRDEQRKLLTEVKHGGMAVSSDVGLQKDVHPTNKKVIGERLARWALLQEYGKKVIPSGPLPVYATYNDGKVVVSLRYKKRLKSSDEKGLRGFSLDGKTEVAAIIQNNKVVIASPQKPAFVYYGWKPFSDGNLMNGENLPASTFKIKVK